MQPGPSLALLVVYTGRLEECRDFYTGLGLHLVREQHGTGPVHYSTTLADGLVLEFYPGRPDRTTGRLRLALTVPGDPGGTEQVLSDPDGRTVVVRHAPVRPCR